MSDDDRSGEGVPPEGPESREPPREPREDDTFEREVEGELRQLRDELDSGATEEREALGGADAEEPDADGADGGEDADEPVHPGGQETIEADVLALGDAEQQREHAERLGAAEKGGEAAAAASGPDAAGEEHADHHPPTWVGGPEPDGAEDAPDPTEGESGDAQPDGEDEDAGEAEDAPEGDAAPEPVPAPAIAVAAGGAGDQGDDVEERRVPALWARFLAGAMLIVIAVATATSVSFLLYLSDVAAEITPADPEFEQGLTEVEPGKPQTILILGSDVRSDIDPKGNGLSDTAMLLRLDPEKSEIALFSLPRDLKVNIPGWGVDKLNAAYSYGGPQLSLKTIRQVTGLQINHLVNVDFAGFAKAVDAIDCVYVDVDRHYFNENTGNPAEAYAEIDVKAGYQRLCGLRALQYVRYRHTDNDIVRAARQQDFLREARQKVPTSKLLAELNPLTQDHELIDIFTKYTTSDIDTSPAILAVLKLFIDARNKPVEEVHFQGTLGESYVTASDDQMQQAVEQFLGVEGTAGPRGGKAGGKPEGGQPDEEKAPKKEKPEKEKEVGGAEVPMIDSRDSGRQYADLVYNDMREKQRFAIKFPTRLPPGSAFSDESRGYEIKLPGGKDFEPAYKLVISYPALGGIIEYFGVEGTTWDDPPILENPSETREIDGASYDLYYAGDRLRLVAWRTDKAVYWLNNTLRQSLTEEQMIAIATNMNTYP